MAVHLADIVVIALVVALYLYPAIVAAYRRASSLGGIMTVNVLLGWTMVGWVVALIWAAAGRTGPNTVRAALGRT